MSGVDKSQAAGGSSDGLSEWLSILAIPLGIGILILFQDTFFDLARWMMVQFNISLITAFGIIGFVLVFVFASLGS